MLSQSSEEAENWVWDPFNMSITNFPYPPPLNRVLLDIRAMPYVVTMVIDHKGRLSKERLVVVQQN